MTDLLVNATHLHKSFGDNHAVDGVSLHIQPGEIYGLVGSDGAGKTTTMRLLVGALRPDEGEIHVCGYDVSKQVEQARSQIGYLSQRFSLYEDLTVLENIRFFAEVRGLSQTEWLPRSLEILEFVGLGDFKDRRAGQLSGGMKQKLGLASALVTRPRLLLLDEPSMGLAPILVQSIFDIIKTINERGTTILLVEQNALMALSIASRGYVLQSGQIVLSDTAHNLRENEMVQKAYLGAG